MKYFLIVIAAIGVAAAFSNPTADDGKQLIFEYYDEALHERARSTGKIEEKIASSAVHIFGDQALEAAFDVNRDNYYLFSVFEVSPLYIGAVTEGSVLNPTFIGAFGTVFLID